MYNCQLLLCSTKTMADNAKAPTRADKNHKDQNATSCKINHQRLWATMCSVSILCMIAAAKSLELSTGESIFIIQVFQLLLGSVEVNRDRAHGNPEDVRDFLIFQLFEVPEHEYISIQWFHILHDGA